MRKPNLFIVLPCAAFIVATNLSGGHPWWAIFWLAFAGWCIRSAVRGKARGSENAEMKVSETPLAWALFAVAWTWGFVLLGLFELDKVPWVMPAWLASGALVVFMVNCNRATNAPTS